MNTKLLTGMGCLLLLAAMTAPAVLGHDDRNDDPTLSSGTTNDNGVSGRYVDSSGPAIFNGGDEIPIPADDPVFTIPEGLFFVGGLMSCDAEVAGPGLTPVPADEIKVDGVDLASANSGTMPDAVFGGPLGNGGWDDGGHGGACHVGTYDVPSYNTKACPAQFAFAQDDTFGNVFIGASCDWESQGGDEFDAGFLVCLANVPNTDVLECLLQLAEVAGNIAECVVQALLGVPCPGGGDDVCGGDGSSDGTNYGWGNFGVRYPSGPLGAPSGSHFGETYQKNADGSDDDGDFCDGEATAAVFVFDYVELSAGDVVNVAEATSGDIWQETGGLVPTFPDCNQASGTPGDQGPYTGPAPCWYPSGSSSTPVLCISWTSVWNPVTMSAVNICNHQLV